MQLADAPTPISIVDAANAGFPGKRTSSSRAFVLGLLGAIALSACGGTRVEPVEPSQSAQEAPPERNAAKPAPTVKSTELDPAHVAELSKRLSSKGSRAAAIKEAIAEFDQAAANGTTKPEAKAFIEAFVQPLVAAYVDGIDDLPGKTGQNLINLLVSFEDPRTLPAHAAAIQGYADEKESVDTAIWACQAAQKHQGEVLVGPLWASFKAIDVSSEDGLRYSRHLRRAMLKNASERWVGDLEKLLEEPIVRPARFDDKVANKAFKNQLFWQKTAAELLAKLGKGSSASALLGVVMDSTKGPLHATAKSALLSLGAESVDLADRLLSGKEPELEEAAKGGRVKGSEPHVHFAAQILLALAPPASADTVLATLKRLRDPAAKAELALVLTRLPTTDESVEAYKKVITQTHLSVTLPGGEGALESLVIAAADLQRPELALWLANFGSQIRGKGPRKGDVQRQLVLSMSRLMGPDELKGTKKVGQQFGGRVEGPAYDAAVELMARCGKKPSCYVKTATSKAQAGETGSHLKLKALTMLGTWGGKAELEALVGALAVPATPVEMDALSVTLLKLADLDTKAIESALNERLAGLSEAEAQRVKPLRHLRLALRARQ